MPSAIEKYKARSAGLRAKLKSAPTERKVGLALAGATLGNLERRGTIPITIMGLPSKPMIAVAAGLVEANSGGMMQRVAGIIADATIAVYFYKVGHGGSFIAGMEEVGQDDDPQGDTEI